jgi:hypothetical protein
MVKLFGDIPAFSAQATVQVLSSNRTELQRMPMVFNALDGKLRLDSDIGMTTGRSVDPAQIAEVKRLRMDRVATIVRPDKTNFMIYPNAQSYAKSVRTTNDPNAAGLKLTRNALGRETIDGHACVKNLSVVRNQKGAALIQAVTWNATDLQNFPLKIEMQENGLISSMHFTQVNLAKPDPRLFEAPANYKQYNSEEELHAAIKKQAAAGQRAPSSPQAPGAQKPAVPQKK